ncbi:MAG: co-chaperone GroES [Terriglobales bacterium]
MSSKPTPEQIKEANSRMERGRLLAGRVMVLPDEPMERSLGGILIPDQAKEKPRSGRVVHVAAEPHRFENGMSAPVECKKGDRVLYGRYGGIEFKDRETGVEYLILAHNDVFMVLPD